MIERPVRGDARQRRPRRLRLFFGENTYPGRGRCRPAVWLGVYAVGIKFWRPRHDATTVRSCVCSTSWRFYAIDATPSPQSPAHGGDSRVHACFHTGSCGSFFFTRLFFFAGHRPRRGVLSTNLRVGRAPRHITAMLVQPFNSGAGASAKDPFFPSSDSSSSESQRRLDNVVANTAPCHVVPPCTSRHVVED